MRLNISLAISCTLQLTAASNAVVGIDFATMGT